MYEENVKVSVDERKMHVLLWKIFCALPGVSFTVCVNIKMIRDVVFEFYTHGITESVSHILSALIIYRFAY